MRTAPIKMLCVAVILTLVTIAISGCNDDVVNRDDVERAVIADAVDAVLSSAGERTIQANCTDTDQILQGPPPQGMVPCIEWYGESVLMPCLSCCNQSCTTFCQGMADHGLDDPNCLSGCSILNDQHPCVQDCNQQFIELNRYMCEGNW